MTRKLLNIALLYFAFQASAIAQALTEAEARQFFFQYIELGEQFDESLADFYSDSAVIKMFRRYPHGLERSAELSGTQWKVVLKRAMRLAKLQNDRSRYQDILIATNGNKALIKATRYSERKCYWDKGYYLIVGRSDGGSLRIIEEYVETQPNSSC